MAFGHKSFIGIGAESTWGTAVARTKFLELVKGGDGIDLEEEAMLSNSIATIGHDEAKHYAQGKISVAGPLIFEFPEEGAELLLKNAFGSVATAVPGGGTNSREHTFTIADALPTGLTVEIHKDAPGGSPSFIYSGCKVNQLEFAIGLDDRLRCTAQIVGKDVAKGAKSSETLPTRRPFHFADAVCKWAGSQVEVSEAKITLNNNLDVERRFIGSRLIKEPIRGGSKVAVTFSFTMEFDSITQFDDWRAATKRVLELTFTGEIIEGAIPYKLQLLCNVSRLTKAHPLINDGGRVTYEIAGMAFRDATDKELKAILTNTVTSV
ncbi:MAG: hypothetical protein HOO67_06180 [Candidatus Peribacteraceae bacterium]|nr:hypothetical protein [Candidatus Peribacteraceae bacterium]